MKKYLLPLIVFLALAGWIYFEKFILPSLPAWQGKVMGREIGKIIAARMVPKPQNNPNPPLEHAVPLAPRVSFSGKNPEPVSASPEAPPAPSN